MIRSLGRERELAALPPRAQRPQRRGRRLHRAGLSQQGDRRRPVPQRAHRRELRGAAAALLGELADHREAEPAAVEPESDEVATAVADGLAQDSACARAVERYAC